VSCGSTVVVVLRATGRVVCADGCRGDGGGSLAEGFWVFYDTLWALVVGFALSGAVQAFVSKA